MNQLRLGEETFGLVWNGLRRAKLHHVSTVGSDYLRMQMCDEVTDASLAFAPGLRPKGRIAGYLSAVGGSASESLVQLRIRPPGHLGSRKFPASEVSRCRAPSLAKHRDLLQRVPRRTRAGLKVDLR